MVSNKIAYGNVNFTNQLLCKDAPASMFHRELAMNAIESTVAYLKKHPKIKTADIKIRALPFNGFIAVGDNPTPADDWNNSAPKFSILNLGGMDENQLRSAMSIGSSVNKDQGIKGNYGIGSKVVITMWSDLLFITRKDGIANMCMIGWRKNEDGEEEFQFLLEDDFNNGIIECTDLVNSFAKERDYPEKHDFTEVILLGIDDASHNTVRKPYSSLSDELPKNTHLSAIFTRFANIPDNVTIRFIDTHGKGSTNWGRGLIFKTWEQVWNTNAGSNEDCIYEVVEHDGYKYHYYYDAPKLRPDGELERTMLSYTKNLQYIPFCAIIHGGSSGVREYYDVIMHNKQRQAFLSRLHLIGGYDHFRMFVELPDDEYRIYKYRNKIFKDNDTENREVKLDDFIPMLKQFMPDSIREKVASHNTGSQKANIDEILEEKFNDYLNDSNNLLNVISPAERGNGSNGNASVTDIIHNSNKNPLHKASDIQPNTSKSGGRGPGGGYRSVAKGKARLNFGVDKPEFEILDEKLVIENGMTDSIGRYVQSADKDVFLINPNHTIINRLLNRVSFDPAIEADVRKLALVYIQVEIGFYHGLIKYDLNKSLISSQDFSMKLSDQSLNEISLLTYTNHTEKLKKEIKRLENSYLHTISSFEFEVETEMDDLVE